MPLQYFYKFVKFNQHGKKNMTETSVESADKKEWKHQAIDYGQKFIFQYRNCN